MADQKSNTSDDTVAISDEALAKAEAFIEADEGATNRLLGWAGTISTGIAVVMSLFHLYAAYAIVPTQELRYVHVAFTLILSFLLFPVAARFRNRVRWWDIVPGIVAIGTIAYALWGGDDFTDRATLPDHMDVIVGIVFIVLLLEATRRTTGLIMPVVSVFFIAYAMLGPHLPAPWTHRGYDLPRLVGHLFITLEGIFGVAVDVSATLIILFTIYGAFLSMSGAGKFFIDFSLSLMGNKSNAAGRTVVLSSFLLGGPSGSGVATTVMIGTVAAPMLAKAGFEKNAAGGLLAAGGLGAILSPPVLGAAAFLIAEFLKISYLDVIWMATIPTCLYYLSLLIMVEIDAKRFGAHNVNVRPELSLGVMMKRYGFHFISLLAVVVFMIIGYSPSLSVFYATLVTFVLSFLRKDTALVPKKLVKALADGSIGALNGHHLRLRRHRGRRRHAHRPRPEILVDRDFLCGRQPAADGDLYGADRLDHRPRGAGDRVLHHLRGDRRAGADQARRARLRRTHVHLLLRGAVGSLAADRAVALRGGGHHRRRSLQDHAAVVEIHTAGVPGAIRLRLRPAGRRPAAEHSEGRLVGGHRRDHLQDHAGTAGTRRRRAELGTATKYTDRARPASAIGITAGVPEPDRGDHRIDHRSRHQLHIRARPHHRPRRAALAGKDEDATGAGMTNDRNE
jgi:hypothetical protein